jgi:hypothetical protein
MNLYIHINSHCICENPVNIKILAAYMNENIFIQRVCEEILEMFIVIIDLYYNRLRHYH